MGWSGATFHASVHSIFGNLYSTTHLDNLMLVSNIEATPTVRLFNLWFEQDLTSQISLSSANSRPLRNSSSARMPTCS